MSCKGRASWDEARTYTISRRAADQKIALNVIRVLKGSDRMRIGTDPPSEERPPPQSSLQLKNLLSLEQVAHKGLFRKLESCQVVKGELAHFEP